MSGSIAINGARVNAGTITIPRYGAWSADVSTAAPVVLASELTFTLSDLSLKGSLVHGDTFVGSTTARVVGGKAGWRKVLPPKGYSHAAGVKLSSVLGDAARETGETIVVSADRTLGAHWTRDEAKAEALLSSLLDGKWWIDENGVTQTSARDSGPIVTPFTVLKFDGAKDSFEIATEQFASWMPGRTFQSSTMPAAKTISSVTITAENDGRVRLTVLAETPTAIDRLRDDLRALIRAELGPLRFAGVWSYTITRAAENEIDAKPDDASMPQITKCKLFPGLIGEDVTPVVDMKCRIVFVNNSPAQPECVEIDGVPLRFKLAGGTLLQGIVRVGDTVQAGAFTGMALTGSTKGFCG